jgi:hypothetical protein
MRACPVGSADKGACACRSSGFQHPALAVAPERYIGAAEGQADTAPANVGA